MNSLFQKIINREIPASIVFENDRIIAIRDINPQAPTHLLIIPKKLIVNLLDAQQEDQQILGELLLASKEIATTLGIQADGYRIVINNGKDAGQEVPHMHLHLLAGRKLAWPPG